MLSLLIALTASPSLTVIPRPAASDTLACITMNTAHLPLATRKSPLDSLSFMVGKTNVKVCYGRPSTRGRVIYGQLVPFGKLWRTGANEPTMIHTTGPITVAGVALAAGSYSLYTVPAQGDWDVILNRSITQWGHESNYTEAVRMQEVGHGSAKTEMLSAPVDTFTIRADPSAAAATALLLEWEKTRVRIPVAPGR